jgi:hypothetical protein
VLPKSSLVFPPVFISNKHEVLETLYLNGIFPVNLTEFLLAAVNKLGEDFTQLVTLDH